MGKNGALLRAKKDNVTYTFTKEQLIAHDKQVIEQKRKLILEDMQKQADMYNERLAEGRKKAEEELKADAYNKYEENFYAGYRYFCCKLVGILVEKFAFPKCHGRANKLTRLLEDLMGEIIFPSEEEVDAYCNQVYDKYGVAFTREDIEEAC